MNAALNEAHPCICFALRPAESRPDGHGSSARPAHSPPWRWQRSVARVGHPYHFDYLTIVDLPPADRHMEFANRIVQLADLDKGRVRVLYRNMTDLSAVSDGTIDLVWSGQSIQT